MHLSTLISTSLTLCVALVSAAPAARFVAPHRKRQVCYQDNALRGLENHNGQSFCAAYLAGSTTAVPTYIPARDATAPKVSSACSCLGAGTAYPSGSPTPSVGTGMWHAYGTGGPGKSYAYSPTATPGAYNTPPPDSAVAAAVKTTSTTSSTTKPASTSASTVKTTSTTSSTAKPASTSSSSAAASSPASPSGGGGGSTGTGKRGLAYNNGALTSAFSGNPKVSWGYNWGNSPSGLASGFEFIPTLWGTDARFTGPWSDAANKAISAGSKHLFSFNEPDLGAQSNLSPAAAAAGYKQYMNPFAGKAKLGAPSITNGAGTSPLMGIDWLSAFLTACSGCSIDFINIHWYDSATNIDYFKKHVQDAYKAGGGKPVWITEFEGSGTAAQKTAFLEAVIPWLDSQDYVERYAWFGVFDGNLVNGNSLSPLGKTYAS
ncbi:MAG: hypothetical protein M1824_004664 [Vezdaea acicularis]|nr:MAG: hypothetical protein M1824_004664 [Vezdaea acicularis]